MAKITLSQDDFFDFVPLLIITALKNQDLIDPDSPAVNLYDLIEKKVLTKLRQYFLAIDPELRRKLKFLIKGIESGNNTVITIKGDNANEDQNREVKYLTENYKPPVEIARKYLRS